MNNDEDDAMQWREEKDDQILLSPTDSISLSSVGTTPADYEDQDNRL